MWANHSPESTKNALHLELGGDSDHGNTLVFTAKRRKNPIYLAVVVFVAFGLCLYSKSHSTLHSALEQVTRLTMERRQVNLQFSIVEKELKQLQRQLVAIDKGEGEEFDSGEESFTKTTSDPVGKESVVDEMIALQETLREGNTQIGSLQRHLQEMSRKDAIKKYGSGIIRVTLELEFPDSPDGPNTLVMEMAPLESMPHSVYMFLEMVNAGLFNGCSFILNAMHVIKAAPLPYDGSSASAKVKAFTKRGLESVAFREYSPDYPHKQYTVGFAADGSPSFYINTQDNTDIHVGDPCFAKIVSGIDTVQRLEASPTRNGIWYRQRIGLKTASIL
jgi:cyclophilin family peptidyl-prolyl cis-trans isomerase